jgi:hypothetical protein
MAIRHVWSVLCRRSSIDIDTNNLSLFESLEEVSFTIPKPVSEKAREAFEKGAGIGFPFDFEIVTFWENLTKETGGKVLVEIKTPSGKVATIGNGELDFKGSERLRLRMRVTTISITEMGRHEILVSHQEAKKINIVAVLPLNIKLELQ